MRNKYIEKVCGHCESKFEASRYDAKYCSQACRTAAHRNRKRFRHSRLSDNWVNQMDRETRENFWYVRDNSDYAAKLIEHIADQYGPHAARLATNAAAAAVDNKMIGREEAG